MFDITLPLDKAPKMQGNKKISLQKQLMTRLRNAILQGELPAGTLLMSSRRLADELGVSRNTVVNAYEHLLAEGYCITDPTGTRVAPQLDLATLPVPTQRAPTYRLPSHLAQALSCRPRLTPNMLLAPGMPALSEFPLTAWRRSLENACQALQRSQLGTTSPLGEERLQTALAQHLYLARGVVCQPEQILITDGAKQALELCMMLFSEPGDRVWVEDPGYPAAALTFRAGNLTVHPLSVDQEGIFIPKTTWQHAPPKLIYTTPAHQYPSGAVLSIARRLSLLAQAQQHGSWIIEDDYDGEFRHQGEPIASMQGKIAEGPVIYMGSFSKTLFPALRLGFVVLPNEVMKQAKPLLHETFRSSNRLQQIALANFIESGEFGRHLARMRRLYRQRQQALRHALQRYFPSADILGGKSGMHLTLKLPDSMDDTAVAVIANQQQLGVRAYSSYFQLPAHKQSGLVIGYGNTDVQRIDAAIEALVKIIHHHVEG